MNLHTHKTPQRMGDTQQDTRRERILNEISEAIINQARQAQGATDLLTIAQAAEIIARIDHGVPFVSADSIFSNK